MKRLFIQFGLPLENNRMPHRTWLQLGKVQVNAFLHLRIRAQRSYC